MSEPLVFNSPEFRAWTMYRRHRYDTRAIAHVLQITEAEADRLLARAIDRQHAKRARGSFT